MDISAAKSLYAATFSPPSNSTNVERVTPVYPVRSQEHAPHLNERPQPPLTYSLESIRASNPVNASNKIAAEKSTTQAQPQPQPQPQVIEQSPDKVSQRYLETSQLRRPSKIDIFV